MEREIKFRIWHIELKEMLYEFALPTNQNINKHFKDLRCPVMQFTGLKDKNGNDIYEGDICRRQLDEDNRYHSNGKWCDIWLIEWLEKTAGFTTTKVADYNVHLKKIVKIPHKQNSFSQRFHELEVIGNIYENPDLISD